MAIPDPKILSRCNRDQDRMVLARLVFGEARGEGDEGRIAVAWTVLNRLAKSKRRYGSTITKVCLRRSQYSCFGSGGHLAAMLEPWDNDPESWAGCCAVADAVLEGREPNPVPGITHYVAGWLYRNDEKCPSWAREPQVEPVEIGRHVFLRGVR